MTGGPAPGRKGAGVSVVGLTGPMGAGKSTIAAMLRGLGANVLDADAIARDELSRGTLGYTATIQRFGTGILGDDREIDRRKLAERVFADPRELVALERILHPRVIARILEARSMLAAGTVLVVEAIKLLDTPLRQACDQVWVVLAPRETLLRRLADRGVSADDALLRLRHQAADDDFRAAADVVIVNDADLAATRAAVVRAWTAIRAERSG